MERTQLECFLAVIDEGSFSAAARRLHLAQSSVSSSIATLEADLDATLLDRAHAGSRPTAAGLALEPHARTVVASLRQAGEEVRSARGQMTGTVRVGLTHTTATIDLAGVLSRLRESHPGVHVALLQVAGGSSGHLTGLADGSLDLALVSMPGDPGHAYDVRPLATEEVVVICPRGDGHLAPDGRLDVALARTRPYLALPAGWGIRTLVDAALVPPDPPIAEVSDYRLLTDLVAAGLGIAFAPRSAVAPDERIDIHPTGLIWQIALAQRRSPRPSAATALVADMLCRADEAPPPGPGLAGQARTGTSRRER